MVTVPELLAAVKRAQGVPSNYALARFLDVPEKSVQRWNTGKHTPDDAMAARLAELAGLDTGEVLASVAAARATVPEVRALWERLANRLHVAGVAALAVILSLWIGGGPDGAAMAATPGSSQVPASVANSVHRLYIVARLIRRRLQRSRCLRR